VLKEIGGDTKQSRISEMDSLHEMLDITGHGNRKRKAESNASMTGSKAGVRFDDAATAIIHVNYNPNWHGTKYWSYAMHATHI
jgi:hypothetical protein